VNQSRRASVTALVVTAGAVAAGVMASPAAAAAFNLTMSAPPNVFVGAPTTVQVIGDNPSWAEYPYIAYLEVDALRPTIVSTCPEQSGVAAQLAATTGGAILTIAQREDTNSEGDFSYPVGLTPTAPGKILICAYTVNEVGATLAMAGVELEIESPTGAPPPDPDPTPNPLPGGGANPPAAAGVPANVAPPRLLRSGRRLVCKPGKWSNDPAGFRYRWLVDGARRRGAAAATLRVTRSLRGHSVRCRVTAANAAGRASALSRKVRVR
jgi:hypothetical protein